MKNWEEKEIGQILKLSYGWSLPDKKRTAGDFPVYGSNGIVGSHNMPLVKTKGLIVGRKGSAGNVHYSRKPFCPIDTTFFVTQEDTSLDIEFLFFLLMHANLKRVLGDVGVPGLNRDVAYKEKIKYPTEFSEQQRIAYVLSTVQTAIEQQERLIKLTRELKSALMHKLFTEGLRGEKQKMTEIGLVPESWEVNSLKQHCNVVTSSLPYTQLSKMKEYHGSDAVELLGIKVSDMNLPGNENRILKSNLIKKVSQEFVQKKAIPPETVIFPKRGAAIATNKKRLTTTWTVFDPNLIGVKTKEGLNTEFIYYWFQRFDLRRITDPGPTPQLNKKDLEPLLIPKPQDISEQIEIVDILRIIDNKINLISEKKGKLEELFRTLLNQLMTGQTRVNDIDLPGFTEG